MEDILGTIIECKREEVEKFKAQLPERVIHARIEQLLGGDVPSMKEALLQSKSGIISEFKRKSPSKGWINQAGKAGVIPLSYQNNGAVAISILTDELFFGGSDSFITEARESGVTIPILYKNFIIDEYQLFQARLCGASAVLLIASCLKKGDCAQLLRTAHELQLEVLLEMHDKKELEYAELEPDIYGINNRYLGSFITNVGNSFRMASLLPTDVVKVSESGISDIDTVKLLRKVGFNGFLIGEKFMKAAEPGKELGNFISRL